MKVVCPHCLKDDYLNEMPKYTVHKCKYCLKNLTL